MDNIRGPSDLVIHGDKLVVLDSMNSRFAFFDLQGNFRAIWPFGVNRTPIAFAFDGEEHWFYVDLDSGGLVATDPHGKVLANYGQMRSFGQRTPGPIGTNFTSVKADALGGILVLRSTLNLETVKLAATAFGSKP